MLSGRILQWTIMSKRCIFEPSSCCINNLKTWNRQTSSVLSSLINFLLDCVLVLQGLSGAAGGFLQIVSLVIYYVKLILLGSTPRSVWGIKYGATSTAWGTMFPGITLLVVITMSFNWTNEEELTSLFLLLLQLLATRSSHLSLTVSPVPPSSCSIGFSSIFSCMYTNSPLQRIQEDYSIPRHSSMCLWDCICSRFACVPYSFLTTDNNGNCSSVPEAALIIVLIVITVCNLSSVMEKTLTSSGNKFRPASTPPSITRMGQLLRALPLSLQDKTYTPPTVEVSGKARAYSSAVDQFSLNRPSVSSDIENLTESHLRTSGRRGRILWVRSTRCFTSTENCMDTRRYTWVIDGGGESV